VPLRREIETIARHARIELTARADVSTAPSDEAPTPTVNDPALTARDRDVVRLVADGHTNREIGDQLYIAEKTASVHVSNTMAKLGTLSRYEAAAMAERTGQLG
jgi:DNA-binding NarL/FixJ family response regulator